MLYRTETYHVFDYSDFESFVEEKLGFPYESVAENEWDNDSSYTSSDVKKTDMESKFNKEYWLPEIEKAIKTKNGTGLNFHEILAYLVWKEFLPEGDYIINVAW